MDMEYTKSAWQLLLDCATEQGWYMSDDLDTVITYIEEMAIREGIKRIDKRWLSRELSYFTR